MKANYAERYQRIGRNIAYYRKKRSLRQKDLAAMLNTETSYVGQLEAPNLSKSFSLDKLFMIAAALEVPVHLLLMDTTENEV